MMQGSGEWGEVGDEAWKDFLARVALNLGKFYEAMERNLVDCPMGTLPEPADG